MNQATYIHLNEMESTKCGLSCKGCYLTQSSLEPGTMPIEKLLHIVNPGTVLTRAYYLNYLPDRDPNTKLGKTSLVRQLEEKADAIFAENIMVTDSLTAKSLDKSRLIRNGFNQVTFSPRSHSSALETLNHFRDWNNGTRLSVIFTAGIDNQAILRDLILAGIKKIELNIAKPYSMKTFAEYQGLKLALLVIAAERGITLLEDSCLDFVASKKNCHNPQDNEWEITVLENSSMAYSCSYTTNTCIAKEEINAST